MWKLKEHNKIVEESLKSKLHPIVARLIAQRENDIDKALHFLNLTVNDLSNPYALNDMEKAVRTFASSVKNKEKIAIISDYDSDGVISALMINELCKCFRIKCKRFFPSRLKNGYGLNDSSINDFKIFIEKYMPDLVFVLDCGSNSEKEILELKKIGIKKIIIIDHHIIDPDKKSISADALVSWHLSNTSEMCTCGEIFQFIRAIAMKTSKIDPIEFITYAAIGTVADIVPLNDDNRIIVKYGLNTHALNHVVASGLRGIMSKSFCGSNLTQEDVQFKIAPRINACGRIQKPDYAFNVLKETDSAMAELMAINLNDYNSERKEMQLKLEKEAIAKVKMNIGKFKNGIVLYDENWHIGIVGIVASTIVETFKKPAIVLGKNNGVWKGSGRSLCGIHLKQILDSCSKEIFRTYGGHSYAAGVTLNEGKLDQLVFEFDKECEKYIKDANIKIYDMYDMDINIEEINDKLVDILKDTVYPYCQQLNPEPIFCLKNVILTDVDIKQYEDLTSLSLKCKSGEHTTKYAFRKFTDEYGTEINGKSADVYFSFPQAVSVKNGMTLNLIDINFSKNI